KMVVAWRVMAFVKLGREQPELPVSEILEELEWQVLRAVERDRRKHSRVAERLPRRPTVAEAMQWVARLGGHLGRRGDGPPGPKSLARGLERLHDITLGVRMVHEVKKCV